MPSMPVLTLREELIEDIQLFCVANDIEPKTISSRVAKDSGFYDRLVAGGDCTTGMYERFQNHFAQNGGVPGSPRNKLGNVA